MAKRLITYDGVKTATLWGGAEEGWIIQGGDNNNDSVPAYFRHVAWLYRAVQLVAGNVASMPFAIVEGETDVDTSLDWQNKLGFMPSPAKLFYLISASMSLTGKAYVWREFNAAKTVRLKYLLPSSVEPKIDPDDGLIGFKRQYGGMWHDKRVEEILYFWLNDPMVEVGPPKAYPALAAMSASGVLFNVDAFASKFFKHGAIKTTIFEAETIGDHERQEFLTWWKRKTSGIANAWSTVILKAKNLLPVTIGEGIQELSNTTLTREEKEAIATALGIPFAILFSDASNYATAQQDWVNFLNNTIIPICNQIAEAFNEQFLEKTGHKLVFRPEGLDAFQEDENQKAAALGLIVTALTTPEEAEIGMKILGYEMDKETQALFATLLAEKKKAREEAAAALAAQPAPVPGTPNSPVVGEEVAPSKAIKDELAKWERKALKSLSRGTGAGVLFESDIIPMTLGTEIAETLKYATTPEEVKASFIQGESKPSFVPVAEPTQPEVDFIKLVDELYASRTVLQEGETKSEQLPPVINIQVPEQPAPIVNITVEPTPVTVNVEPSPVTVTPNITVQPAPVTIQKPAKKPSTFAVQRNRDGMITGIEEKQNG